jgi:hypothetical protein
MPGSGIFIDYAGLINHKMIDHLLKKLKKTKDFKSLDKTTGRRVYAIMVECLENIAKHSLKKSFADGRFKPFISAGEKDEKIFIKAGNPIHQNIEEQLAGRLNRVNKMDDEALTCMYEKIINKETKPEENGAGLGFILMKLKSGNPIDCSFSRIDNDFSYFEIQIIVNKYIMRKLIIEKTASSPKVILDPDKKIFEISGESRPPDVGTFYGEILSWMDDYSSYLTRSREGDEPVVFNFDFEYFNSSSAKYILDFCKQITSVRSKGKNIEAKWHYEKNDADMLEVGREMSRISRMPFEFVEKDKG